MLKDPDSIKQPRVTVSGIVGWPARGAWMLGWQVCYAYNAKNSNGAYVGVKQSTMPVVCSHTGTCYAYSNVTNYEPSPCSQ